jgi:hypothetical protein
MLSQSALARIGKTFGPAREMAEHIMALPSMSFFGIVFLLVFALIAWLKYREHLHAHRHEHGRHSDRHDLLPHGHSGRH